MKGELSNSYKYRMCIAIYLIKLKKKMLFYLLSEEEKIRSMNKDKISGYQCTPLHNLKVQNSAVFLC